MNEPTKMNVNQKTFDRAISVSVSNQEWADDLDKMVEIARLSFGIGMSPCEAERVWRWWSSKHCAQWLYMDTGSIQTAIVNFIIEYAKS